MARPRSLEKRRWKLRGVAIGYVESRNGMATIRIGDSHRSCRVPFLEEHRAFCLKLLRDAVSEHEFRRLSEQIGLDRALAVYPQFRQMVDLVQAPARRLTVYDAIERFVAARFPSLGGDVRIFFRRAFVAYVPEPDSIVLEYRAVADHLIDRNVQLVLAPATRAKYLRLLKRMFRDAVLRGDLVGNPVDLVGIPKVEISSERVIYSRDEVAKIFRYYRSRLRSGYPEQRPSNRSKVRRSDEFFALYWRFLLLTGMRFVETSRLRRSDVTADQIMIDGKAHRVRFFPLEPWPEVREILRDVCKLWESEYVWPWRHVAPVWRELQVVKAACGIELGNVHTWRATAEDRWLNEFGIDPKDFCDLAGHSQAVFEKHYKPKRKARDLERALIGVRRLAKTPGRNGFESG